MKTCTKCGKHKSLSEFFKRASAPDGLTWFCKTCSAAQTRLNEQKNAHRVAARVSVWRARNLDVARGICRDTYSRHQTETSDTARNHRKEWTGPELELAADASRTTADVAKALGRTYSAVTHIRRAIRMDPRKAKMAGTNGGTNA